MQGIIIIILFVVSWVGLSAQDPHFSVFYGVPIGVNPAYTGNFNGNFRVSAQYRDQWNSVLTGEAISAYRTAVASFEARTNKGIDENDFVGMGAYFLYDVAGQSRLSNTKFGLSAAYRKALDQYGDHFITIGGQVAANQKKISLKDLTWGTQWNGTRYDETLPGQSGNLDDNIVFYDISTGISWGYNKFGTRNRFSAGLGLLHINQPKESFFRSGTANLTTAQIPMRINLNVGAGIQMATSLDIMPKMLFMKQGQNMETMFGTDVRMIFDPSDENSNSFYVGAMMRVVGGSSTVQNGKSLNMESVIATARMDYNNIEMGVAYDINVSDLSPATKFQGGFELYINYVFRIKNTRQRRMFCPKF
jgi:type IX secretion system PorP/SprF family membrane protein